MLTQPCRGKSASVTSAADLLASHRRKVSEHHRTDTTDKSVKVSVTRHAPTPTAPRVHVCCSRSIAFLVGDLDLCVYPSRTHLNYLKTQEAMGNLQIGLQTGELRYSWDSQPSDPTMTYRKRQRHGRAQTR